MHESMETRDCMHRLRQKCRGQLLPHFCFQDVVTPVEIRSKAWLLVKHLGRRFPRAIEASVQRWKALCPRGKYLGPNVAKVKSRALSLLKEGQLFILLLYDGGEGVILNCIGCLFWCQGEAASAISRSVEPPQSILWILLNLCPAQSCQQAHIVQLEYPSCLRSLCIDILLQDVHVVSYSGWVSALLVPRPNLQLLLLQELNVCLHSPLHLHLDADCRIPDEAACSFGSQTLDSGPFDAEQRHLILHLFTTGKSGQVQCGMAKEIISIAAGNHLVSVAVPDCDEQLVYFLHGVDGHGEDFMPHWCQAVIDVTGAVDEDSLALV
mmetsp:Transcript_18157/g.42434  ORF Transcript_18157/g.42434 Transcript_18157/m.42434 type:complete len:323 (-) Transcript_18157:1659-2627(-)